MTIKFLDLQAQYQSIKRDVDAAVLGVLESGHYVLGPEVTAFEEEFADAHGAAYGIAVNSGTSALHLALLAAGIEPGNEVIIPAMTFTATGAAVAYTGATPVFADVRWSDFTIDPEQIAAKVTPRTKAIIPVHLYGQPADMHAIGKIAERHGLLVIEDAAQAHLAEYNGRKVGGIGHVGAFSFYPGKNLGAYGEGGLITTNDSELAQKMRLYRDWGAKKKYDHEFIAYNYRMDAVQGAILRVKLRHLADWTERRRLVADFYRQRLDGLETAVEAPGRKHVYHIFSVFHRERDRLQEHLANHGIQTGKHYPIPLHLQKAFEGLGHQAGAFPVSERIANTQLSLPIYPELVEDELNSVATAVRSFK